MTKISALLLLIACVQPFLSAQEPVDLTQIRSLIKSGQGGAVAGQLEAMAKTNPDNEEMKALLGLALSQLGSERAADALKLLRAADGKNPANTDYLPGLCRACRQLGGAKLANAAYYCAKTIAAAPANPEGYIELGLVYKARKKIDKAVETWEKGLKSSPGSYMLRYHLGAAYLEKGKYQKAITELRKADVLARETKSGLPYKDLAKIMLALGDALAKTGKMSEALFAYDEAENNDNAIGVIARRKKKELSAAVKNKKQGLSALDAIDNAREKTAVSIKQPPLPAKRKLSKERKARLTECINSAQGYYKEEKYADSEAQFRKCLEIQPADENSRISLAGVLMLQNKTGQAEKEFELSLRLMAPKSQMRAYAHSRLGDISMKTGDMAKAGLHYKKALAHDPNDVNAQVGLGKYYETQKNWPAAAAAYRRGLELESGNSAAREGLRRIEPHVMSAQEILSEMKERKALPAERTLLSDDDRQLFNQMRNAEEMRAVDYLKKKMWRIPESHLVSKNPKTGSYRLMLTLAGYKAYQSFITKDAIKYFEGKGLRTRDLFTLKDINGKDIFSQSGLLSYEGLQVYYSALIGEKTYLLPGEPLPPSALAALSEEERKIAELKNDGFMEIGETEYLWLVKVTDCSDETFRERLEMKFIEVPDKKRRYFIDITGQRKDKGILASYIAQYRNGQTDLPDGRSTGFFGLGSVEGKKLCKSDGKIWEETPNPVGR